MAQINALHLGELRTRRGQNKLQLGLEQSIVNTQSNYYKTCFMAQSSSASPTAAGIQNIEHITYYRPSYISDELLNPSHIRYPSK
jgi:hypothetical protein